MNWSLFAWCVLGVVISVVLPSLWATVRTWLPKAAPAGVAGKSRWSAVWKAVKPYFALGLASALTSVLLLAVLGDRITSPQGAILAGYAWDSTLQKLHNV
jgi:hypothetical protein